MECFILQLITTVCYCVLALSAPPSLDVEIFNPELVENCAEDGKTDEYRFFCPTAGQFMCKLTNIVFEMKDKGEVLYRIVPWDDHVLDGFGQMQPAGPLYSIKCSEASILHLHLPHCETAKDGVELAVAHVTDGNVEIIQPLRVTNTHVIIDFQGLSLFGVILQRYGPLVRAQVLLFYKTIAEYDKIKLHIHLLPANVPVNEVKKQHESYTYLTTTSVCELIPGKHYKCKTTDPGHAPKPEVRKFEREYGPNYHPTFLVYLNIDVSNVTLILSDEKNKLVWKSPPVIFTGTENTPGADTRFVDKHRETLIQKVSSVMEIADCLISQKLISDEMCSNIQAKSTDQEKMRELYRHLISRNVKEVFYQILKKERPWVIQDLESEEFS